MKEKDCGADTLFANKGFVFFKSNASNRTEFRLLNKSSLAFRSLPCKLAFISLLFISFIKLRSSLDAMRRLLLLLLLFKRHFFTVLVAGALPCLTKRLLLLLTLAPEAVDSLDDEFWCKSLRIHL